MSNTAIRNLITGQYVAEIDWTADRIRWTYSPAAALVFPDRVNAELLIREYGIRSGWMVPA